MTANQTWIDEAALALDAYFTDAEVESMIAAVEDGEYPSPKQADYLLEALRTARHALRAALAAQVPA